MSIRSTMYWPPEPFGQEGTRTMTLKPYEAQEIDLASARAEIASLRSAIELVKWDCREEAENLAHSRAVRIAYSRVEEQINVILAAHPQTEQAEQVRDVLRDGLRNARLASPAPVTLAEQHARRRLGEWLAANPSRSWHWHGDDGQTQYTVVLYQYECSWAGSGNSLAEAIARALDRAKVVSR